jgi:predicted nucleotidyltransferase
MDFRSIAQRNEVLKIRAGSHLFGTNTPESDLDFVGVFMPCSEQIFGFETCGTVDMNTVAKDGSGRNTAEAIDYSLHEFRKFAKLALENNPNILHLIFANPENVLVADPEFGQPILDRAGLFPHRGAHHRFVAYAHAQLHKMRIKPENYCKFASNVIHLLREGIDLMRTGRLVFPLSYADEILAIKQGKFEAAQIEEMADQLLEEARQAYEQSVLPVNPRRAEVEAFVIDRMRAWTARC